MTIKGHDNKKLAENYQNWLASPYIAERYWYVRALGANRSTAAGKALMTALDDPNTNVVCMAYYSLGRSGNTNVIDELKKRILSSNKWYEQFYAYRAIRALGWQQSKTP
jgi:HEAT repeat protein